ncbi:MAG: type II toxin-antitoxin system RelE/ParE family toxin [Bacteroidia bacterium]|nr:type II toxin-antitoxin system RelE/ParE family toxin [Bacteroidia bacterium]
MAKKIIWSTRATASFDKIIKYLEKDWTKKEIEKLVSNTQKVLQQIESGSIKFRTSGKKDIHEVLVTKHNLLIYRIKKNQIDLLVFYDTRQHPKKKKF